MDRQYSEDVYFCMSDQQVNEDNQILAKSVREYKKVAIITLHLFDNIGGILQAFALNKLITEAGYDAETIT